MSPSPPFPGLETSPFLSKIGNFQVLEPQLRSLPRRISGPGIDSGGWFSGRGRAPRPDLFHMTKSPGLEEAVLARAPAQSHPECGTPGPAGRTEDLQKGWWGAGVGVCVGAHALLPWCCRVGSLLPASRCLSCHLQRPRALYCSLFPLSTTYLPHFLQILPLLPQPQTPPSSPTAPCPPPHPTPTSPASPGSTLFVSLPPPSAPRLLQSQVSSFPNFLHFLHHP